MGADHNAAKAAREPGSSSESSTRNSSATAGTSHLGTASRYAGNRLAEGLTPGTSFVCAEGYIGAMGLSRMEHEGKLRHQGVRVQEGSDNGPQNVLS